jgi:uncharacterized protein (TIGR02679 family)
MNTPSDGRLQRLLGGEPLVPLRKRLRQRFERGALDENIERFRISNLTVEEHTTLALLLGRPVRFSSSMQVDVHAIDAALQRAGIAKSLRQALEQIDGPIVHIETSRRQLEATWSDVTNRCSHPSLIEFLQAPAGIGLLKRLSRRDPDAAAQLCSHADTVLQSLPANGITRAQLAANTLGNAHALDSGQAVATIVLAVWRQVIAPLGEVEDALPVSQDDGSVQHEIRDERARDVWARAGVLVNELARPALFLNLSASGNRSYVQSSGEPGFASLRFLLRSPPSWTVAGRDVFVCENPNLLAIAADELGPRCAPMICTDGMPAAAQRSLLTQLARAGARLRYHGDFDWPGLHIGNHVMREYGAQPWRFGAVEYTVAVQSAPRPGQPLRGAEVVASWDEALASAMRRYQLAIPEESLAGSLLQDLIDASLMSKS